MSINLGMRHDRLLRKQAAQMFEKGCGYGLTARRLGMSAATVREGQKMYRVIRKGGLLAMGVKHTKYDYETKVAAFAHRERARVGLSPMLDISQHRSRKGTPP